ncbi:recombinase family protein [Paraburkholderia metrosideri]|uniref:Recombinase family protein n=1 Tax=Paraburkholderia metrosideri TaxID=580937 RepID=A0ABW9E2Y9_9BURK
MPVILIARGVKLALGSSVYDPIDSMDKMFLKILATFAEFEANLIRMSTHEGMAIECAKGKLRGEAAKIIRQAATRAAPNARRWKLFDP